MRTIEREELKAKIDAGEDFALVMTMGLWAFEAAHIPGSIQIDSPDSAAQLLNPDDEIVVYCSDPACIASRYAQEAFLELGYENVSRFEGGLADWAAAGFELAGERAEQISLQTKGERE